MAQYAYTKSSNPINGDANASNLVIGRVTSIVLGPELADGTPDPNYKSQSDIGAIRFEKLYDTISTGKTLSDPAYPIFNFVRQYPVLSEIVLIVRGPGTDLNDSKDRQALYYFPPYSLWGGPNHNAFPNMKSYLDYVKTYYANGTAAAQKSMPKLPMGYSFVESDDIRPLRAFEGDTIIESRFGQSIRFGSTNREISSKNPWSNSGVSGQPITIIRNGQGKQPSTDSFSQTVENANTDDAMLFLTSGQSINISDISEFPLKTLNPQYSSDATSTRYTRTAIAEKADTSKIMIAPNQQKVG
jgi:hypothetical protein